MKHVFLFEFGLWRNPATKMHQILFRFFGYHTYEKAFVKGEILSN